MGNMDFRQMKRRINFNPKTVSGLNYTHFRTVKRVVCKMSVSLNSCTKPTEKQLMIMIIIYEQ